MFDNLFSLIIKEKNKNLLFLLAVVSDFKPTLVVVSVEVVRLEIVLFVVALGGGGGACLVKFFIDLDFLLAVLTGLATTGVISLSGKGCCQIKLKLIFIYLIKINNNNNKTATHINYFDQLMVT